MYVDLGQPCEDRPAILNKARDAGAAGARIVDAQEELCRDFAFPVLQWQAKYESIYLLGTSIARPLIAKKCLQVAREVGEETFAHGATGRQRPVPFPVGRRGVGTRHFRGRALAAESVPRQIPRTQRDDRLLRAAQIPVKASVSKPYSSDENCLHISYEAGKLEDLNVNGVELVEFGMTVSPQQAPDKIENVKVAFEAGVPVAVNGQRGSAFEIVRTLNEIGGRNGVGRVDMVENRFVGMKSRGVYESPGMTILY